MFFLVFFLLMRMTVLTIFFFFSSRRRHTRSLRDWSSDVCSSDLDEHRAPLGVLEHGDVDLRVVGRGDHDEHPLEIGRAAVAAALPADRALARILLERRLGL